MIDFLIPFSLFMPFGAYYFFFPLLLLTKFKIQFLDKRIIIAYGISLLSIIISAIYSSGGDALVVPQSLKKIILEILKSSRFFVIIAIYFNFLIKYKNNINQSIFTERIKKYFFLSLQINSLVAIVSLALPSLRELIIILYRQGNVDEYIRPIGLTSGYEFSAFASIILAIISYNKQNYIFFLIGLFAASITGRTGLLFSAIYLIYLLIYNLLSAINISIIQEKIKLKRSNLLNFLLLLFTLVTSFLLLYNFLQSSIFEEINIQQIINLFLIGEADSVNAYRELGISSYNVISSFKSDLPLKDLLIGTGTSEIFFSKTDSGWFRILNRGGILLLLNSFYVYYLVFRETYLLKIKDNKYIKSYFNLAIPIFIFITLMNTKILSLTSSFTFDLIILSFIFLIPYKMPNSKV